MRSTFTTTDQHEARRILHALDMALVLYDYSYWLRDQLKHNGAGQETDEAREMLFEIMDRYGINLDTLIQ